MLDSYHHYLDFLDHHQRLVWLTVGVYMIGLVVLMLVDNISITPDRLTLALFIAALAMGQGVRFLRDWVPFILLLFAYEGLRGIADGLTHVNITNVIAVERWLGNGSIPTVWLQSHFYHGSVGAIDIIATLFYFLHFPLPLFTAFWLWLKHKQQYWQFVICLLLLCFAGFVTYIVFPADPPWLASQQGYLPHVTKIIDKVLGLFPHSMSISYFYHSLNPNQVAAMPSLHAAFPWLVFLILWRVKGKKALWFLPYCFGLWFSIVYLGEHYVADAIAGIIYAQIAFWLGSYGYAWVCEWWENRRQRADIVVIGKEELAEVREEV